MSPKTPCGIVINVSSSYLLHFVNLLALMQVLYAVEWCRLIGFMQVVDHSKFLDLLQGANPLGGLG